MRSAAARAPRPRPPAAERYRGRLLRYVSRLTAGDHHRAEDIVQETMVRAWLAADEFAGTHSRHQEEDHLAAWLHIVARNLAVDARRRDRSVPVGIMPETLHQRSADDGADLAEAVANRVTLARLLARLSPQQRAALTQVHGLGLSQPAAARALGVPAGTVKSRVHYALATLRRELSPSS
ncbi:sigma-70 family RNA polymerase sigma factor [Streptomyces aidingensis]|uniref:sigma-70 family RNA polymerase sigma factor n=1 Tax=Streptomyces aidingensis TaxID=910347 RepID=UPI001FE4576B|nr:sigma-70 family RNA polymerase sigma factor [Streptomyces aidingensis]